MALTDTKLKAQNHFFSKILHGAAGEQIVPKARNSL